MKDRVVNRVVFWFLRFIPSLILIARCCSSCFLDLFFQFKAQFLESLVDVIRNLMINLSWTERILEILLLTNPFFIVPTTSFLSMNQIDGRRIAEPVPGQPVSQRKRWFDEGNTAKKTG